MEKMRFDINGLGRFVTFKGKVTRTPCTIDVTNKKDLDFLKRYLESFCIQFKLYPTPKREQKTNKKETVVKSNSVQEVEVEEKKPVTILEKLAAKEKIEGLNNNEEN